MQQQTEQIVELVQEVENSSYELNVQAVKLDTVQTAVARLMERIDGIVHNGWHEDRAMAYLSINEIEQTVRLIDMAFVPLMKEMSDTIKKLSGDSAQLFEVAVKHEPNPQGDKLNIDSPEGWNYFAMENNIKTFIKEVGREPESFEEVSKYIIQKVAKVVAANEEENKKADAPTSTNEI